MLSKSIEDYLECIYLISLNSSVVKVTDVASQLGVTLPSVTGMIRKLKDSGFVVNEKYGLIKLTSKGKRIAKRVYGKHLLLEKFFLFLGVDEKIASSDACKVEHVLSSKTLNQISVFLKNNGVLV